MNDPIDNLFAEIEPSFPSTTQVVKGNYRLDATFYSLDIDRARAIIESSHFPKVTISSLAKVFALSDFSLLRIPAINESLGAPFFTVSDIQEFDPKPSMFLSKSLEPNLNDYIVKPGWILVSRSGSIGNVVLVGSELEGKAVANHAIRVVPKDSYIGAFLYVILSGHTGRTLLEGNTYGSVVDQIKPYQIEQISVPVPDESTLTNIEAKINQALTTRSMANALLHDADLLVHEVNGLPHLNDEDAEWYDPERVVESVIVQSKESSQNNGGSAEYRLDGHYYNPLARLALNNIKGCSSDFKALAGITDRIIIGPRFKRNYVESDYGTPFLSGKSLVQIKPELKHLSNTLTDGLDELLVERGWTLITCSGTLGRTSFVWNNYENYAASQHILRVVPNVNIIDSGYLYAFLSSRYGYEQILKYRHGSVIDEITDKQISRIIVPYPNPIDQKIIGDKVREAYDKRAEVVRLENEAQNILMGN